MHSNAGALEREKIDEPLVLLEASMIVYAILEGIEQPESLKWFEE